MTNSCKCTQTTTQQYSGPKLSFDATDFPPVPRGQQLGTWGNTTDNRRIYHTFVFDVPQGCTVVGGHLQVSVARESNANNDSFHIVSNQGGTSHYGEAIWQGSAAQQRLIDVDLSAIGLLGAGQLSFLVQDDTTVLNAELALELCCSCEAALERVDEELAATTADHVNGLVKCGHEAPTMPGESACRPLEVPAVEPTYHVTWGDSDDECIESCETLHLVICNPYDNVTLCDVTVPRIHIVDESGEPVPTLPDGTPLVHAIPVGPFCFGDIGPCSCVSRAFVLRHLGEETDRKYQIVIDDICFSTTFCHRDDACFEFAICAD